MTAICAQRRASLCAEAGHEQIEAELEMYFRIALG
jgi:hypothetical protein